MDKKSNPLNSEQANNAVNLDAKLHQGYDPSTEFKHTGNLFSSVDFSEGEKRAVESHGPHVEKQSGLLARLIVGISTFFDPNWHEIEESRAQESGIGLTPAKDNPYENGTYKNSQMQSSQARESLQNTPGLGPDIQQNLPQLSNDPQTSKGGNAASGGGGGGGGGGDDAAEQPQPEDSAPAGNGNNNAEPALVAPSITVSFGQAWEGQSFSVVIGLNADPSADHTLVTIAGLPAGTIASAGTDNGDGTWTFTEAQLVNLSFTTPEHDSGHFALTFSAESFRDGHTATTTLNDQLDILGSASAPDLHVHAITGNEDAPIALNISAALTDTDGSETLSILIAGVPPGATLSAGTQNGNGTWSLTENDLTGLTLTPPLHYSGQINLTITATSSENGTTASTSALMPVDIIGVATAPLISVLPATGLEDSPISLNITAALQDNDGSETLNIIIANVPAGAILSAGVDNGGGVWVLTPADLTGLTLTPPADFHGNLALNVTAASVENGAAASASATLNVSVAGTADAAALSVLPATGNEDTPIALVISASATDPAETLSIIIGNIPPGAHLSAGTDNGDGTWTLNSSQLTGLTFSPPAHAAGAYNLSVTAITTENGTTANATASLNITVDGVAGTPTLSAAAANGVEDTAIALTINATIADNDGSETLSIIVGNLPPGAHLSAGIDNGDGTWTLNAAQLTGLTFTPPQHTAGSYTLSVTAISAEGGTTASANTTLNITVGGVAGIPTLSAAAANGVEDTPVSLLINATIADNDGSEALSITIGNLPPGAHLSAGTDNGNGTWTLTPAQLAGLTFIPPAHASGSYDLTVTATSSEGASTASTNTNLHIEVSGSATTPSLSVTPAIGTEDAPIALAINAGLVDNDGSETLTITIANVPPGAILSAGTHNADGTWTLAPGDLTGLTLTPPLHYSGNLDLIVTATSTENGTSSDATLHLPITVQGIAIQPLLSVSSASGAEDTPITLNIGAALAVNDAETLSINISNLPAGAVLSAGTQNPDGSWTLGPAQLTGLTLIPAQDYSGNVSLNVVATTSLNGTTASSNATLAVSITGAADAPTVSVQAATGNEDTAIALNISAALTDTDGSETLSITIGGLPADAMLSSGVHNPDGTWTLTPAQLSGLTLTPGANWSGTSNLSITATSSENGTTATTSTSLPLTVHGIADVPSLSAQAASGNEDSSIALHINAALTDTSGGEILSIIIANLPAGAVLSAGIDNGDGTWTLTPAQLTGLTLTPAVNWSGTSTLSITAISSEEGTTATASATLPLTVLGVADAPSLSVLPATGNEDTTIALNISAALVDAGAAETLSINIGGLPSGATLSAGIHNPDGSWTLTPAQLDGLSLIPGAHWSGTSNLSITATSSENGTTATTSTSLALTVHGVADVPTLSVLPATGNEDGAIALHINSALTDTDGSETLTVTIGGVPSGAILSAGTHNPDGTWTLNAAQLTNLTLTPAANFTGLLNLSVTATASEDGTSASSVPSTLPVTVHGIADTPLLSIQAAAGNEDTAIALHINAAAVDSGETLSINIAGVPNGATLSAGIHNPDNTWTLTPAQLTNLTMTPPVHWSGSVDLTITATSSQDGTTASTSTLLPVVVAGVATTPLLTVGTVFGAENVAMILPISAALVDTDGSETLSVTIGGLPAGAILSAGTNNGNGTWTLTPAQLGNVLLVPGLNWNGTTALTITATSSENGTTASTTASLPVNISAIAHTPSLSVQGSTGAEDTPIALHISSALSGINPLETMSVTIAGVPGNAVLSAGINNHDGTWTLSQGDLSGLTLTTANNYSGNLNLTVTSTSEILGSSSSVSTSLPITVTGVADAPTLSVQAASGAEDNAVTLNIASALTDADGSETLSINIANLPAGATLSAGVHNQDGSYTLTPAQLSGLILTPGADWSGSVNLVVTSTSSESGTTASTVANLPLTITGVADMPTLSAQAASGAEDTPIALHINAALSDTDASETLSVIISGLPAGVTLSAGTHNPDGSYTLTAADLGGLTLTSGANWSGSTSLSITATASENGTTASTTTTLPLTVTGVADVPTLSVQSATGNEDTAIALSITSSLTDNDGSESLAITIGGLPTGAILSAGINNGNGTWSLTPAQLGGLTLTPGLNYSGNTTLTVTSTSSENGTTASTTANLSLTVNGVADTPTLSVQAASGSEDTAIALHINAGLSDTDGSETLTVTVSGLPAGATLSAGTHNPDGSYTLTAADLGGLTLTPGANWSGSTSLSVTAISSENGTTASTATTLPLVVTGVADAPTLSVQTASGNEDTAIALNITAALADTDGSETLTITISGLPAGAALSSGINNGNGTWTLTPAQLGGLSVTPGANYNGNSTLTITATSSESGTNASTTTTLPLSVNGVADAPTLSVQSSTGNEDNVIALHITAGLTDTDGSETLSIIIGNLPLGAVLSAGTHNANGTWTLTPAQLNNLSLTPPANYSGGMSLSVTATSSENGTTASTNLTLPVTVAGVADAPTVSTQAATGSEDTAIALHINTALTDTSGAEILSITIGNLPTGSILSAGINNGNGTWTLTPAQLSGLTLTPGANWSGTSNISVTATSSENGTTASTATTLPLTVTGVADAPTLSVQSASGNEDTVIALHITSALVDTDGSETLSINISGVPAGATLSAGTHNPDGSWTLTPGQLTNLTLTPGANYSGDVNLSVTSTSSEAGTTASTSTTLPLHVIGIADIPTLSIQSASGSEDSAIALHINAALTDTDGSERLSIAVGGMPAGATLSAGINNGDGTWSLTTAQLSGLTLTPPANWSGDFTLSVSAASSENGTWAKAVIPLHVNVVSVADTPTLTVAAATGLEDTAIALNIHPGLSDSSESLSLMISGVPAGATLSAGLYAGNGHWSLTSADLTNLTITPPANYSGTINLQAVAVSTASNGDTATLSLPVNVTVTPVADTPTLVVGAVTGKEDNAIALNINAGLRDNDNSEYLTVAITGVPTGATLSAGTNAGGGVWNLTAAQLTNLKITPPANSDADFTLGVTVTSHENGNGATSSISGNIPVTVTGVADTPTITIGGTGTFTGIAGSQVVITMSGAVTDSSESISYIIHGIPDGFALNHGNNNGDNSWTLTTADLSGLKIVSPETFNGQLTLYAQSVSHDNDGSIALSTATSFKTQFGTVGTNLIDLGINLNVGGIGVGAHVGVLPDIELFPVSGGIAQVGTGIYAKEDVPFVISDASLLSILSPLAGVTNLIAKFQFQGVPAGTTFSTGTNKGGGVWEFSLGQLASNITMTTPANSDSDFTINVVAKMLLGLLDVAVISTPVHIMGVADMPTLTASVGGTTEDNAVALNISGALTDTDGSETLSYLVAGLPTGFTLNHGIDNGNGTWSVQTADLSGLTVTPAANYSGSVNLTIGAISTEREGDQAVKETTVTLNVSAVADAPAVAPLGATGTEDHSVSLNLGITLKDTDGSESISAVIISGLPSGAALTGATDNHNGTWSADVNHLDQVQFVPGNNWHGDATLTITATSREASNGATASTTTTMGVHIDAIADAPVATATDSSGTVGNAIGLHVAAALTDSNEHLSAVISGIPHDAILSAGINNGDGTWTLTGNQLSNLQLTPADHFTGDLNLALTAYSREDNGSIAASSSQSFAVHVTADPGNQSGSAPISWIDATDTAHGGTPADPVHTASQDAQAAIDSASLAAHTAGSDYQNAFQSHQTG